MTSCSKEQRGLFPQLLQLGHWFSVSHIVLKSTFTPVFWKQDPQRCWWGGKYAEHDSLPAGRVQPPSEQREKETGWPTCRVKHHRFILLKPKQWKFNFWLCKENKQRQWHFHSPKQFIQINMGKIATSLLLIWALIKDFALWGWRAITFMSVTILSFSFKN